MDLKTTYNKIAKDWMQDHRDDTWWIEGTDTYLSFLTFGALILDVGCGGGEKSKYFIEKGFSVVGVDFSEEMIRFAKEKVPAGQFFVKDIQQPLGLKDKFDGVIAQAVLLHIPKRNILAVLKNIIAPLKLGGYFYAALKEKKSGGPDEETVRENDYGHDYERFFSYFTLSEVKDILARVGLQVLHEYASTSRSKTHWIQIIAKKTDITLL